MGNQETSFYHWSYQWAQLIGYRSCLAIEFNPPCQPFMSALLSTLVSYLSRWCSLGSLRRYSFRGWWKYVGLGRVICYRGRLPFEDIRSIRRRCVSPAFFRRATWAKLYICPNALSYIIFGILFSTSNLVKPKPRCLNAAIDSFGNYTCSVASFWRAESGHRVLYHIRVLVVFQFVTRCFWHLLRLTWTLGNYARYVYYFKWRKSTTIYAIIQIIAVYPTFTSQL